MDYRFNSFASDRQLDSNYFVQPSVSISDDEAVQKLRNNLLSTKNSATIFKEAASMHSRIWFIDKILLGLHRESIVSAKPITSGNHREIQYRGTTRMCITLGEIIEDKKRRVREKRSAADLKEREKGKKRLRKIRSVHCDGLQGAIVVKKIRKAVAVEGLLALTQENLE